MDQFDNSNRFPFDRLPMDIIETIFSLTIDLIKTGRLLSRRLRLRLNRYFYSFFWKRRPTLTEIDHYLRTSRFPSIVLYNPKIINDRLDYVSFFRLRSGEAPTELCRLTSIRSYSPDNSKMYTSIYACIFPGSDDWGSDELDLDEEGNVITISPLTKIPNPVYIWWIDHLTHRRIIESRSFLIRINPAYVREYLEHHLNFIFRFEPGTYYTGTYILPRYAWLAMDLILLFPEKYSAEKFESIVEESEERENQPETDNFQWKTSLITRCLEYKEILIRSLINDK